MGRSNHGGRTSVAPSRSGGPASFELRFEHDRSPETAERIERLPAGAEGPDGPD